MFPLVGSLELKGHYSEIRSCPSTKVLVFGTLSLKGRETFTNHCNADFRSIRDERLLKINKNITVENYNSDESC